MKRGSTYLIIEAPVAIEIIEVRGEGFSAPKFHIGDLKVVVNCHHQPSGCSFGKRERRTGAEVVLDAAVV
jgi:hypothetical protein